MIENYGDFCNRLLEARFSLGSGGNDDGVFSLLKHSWNEQPPDTVSVMNGGGYCSRSRAPGHRRVCIQLPTVTPN